MTVAGRAEVPRVLVTGATGFLGRNICAVLTGGDVEVVGLARRHRPGPWDAFVAGDVSDPEAAWPVAAGDLVIHAAGLAHDLTGRNVDGGEYWRVNADGARHAARAVRQSGGRGLILLSTVKAMAETTGPAGVDESFRCCPTTLYGKSKLAGERLAAAELKASTCVLTILRLTPVYGEGDRGNLQRLVRLSRKRAVPWLPKRTGQRSMVHVQDVARLAEVLVHNPVPGTFIVDDGRTYTPRGIQELVRGGSPTGSYMAVPAAAIRAAGLAGSVLATVTGRPGVFTNLDAHRLLEHAIYDGSKLRANTSWRPVQCLGSEISKVGLGQR